MVRDGKHQFLEHKTTSPNIDVFLCCMETLSSNPQAPRHNERVEACRWGCHQQWIQLVQESVSTMYLFVCARARMCLRIQQYDRGYWLCNTNMIMEFLFSIGLSSTSSKWVLCCLTHLWQRKRNMCKIYTFHIECALCCYRKHSNDSMRSYCHITR